MVSLSQYILHTMGLKPLPYWKSFWYQTPCRIFSISDVFSDSIHTIQNLKGEMHFHDSENIMVPDKWFDFLEKFWLEKEDAKNKTTFRLLLAGWSFIVLNWIQFWNWGGGGGGKSMKYIEIHHSGWKSLVDLIWSGWKKLFKKLFLCLSGALGGLSLSLGLIFSPLTVGVCKRKSTRLTAVIGGLVLALGCLFSSFANQFHQLFFSHAIMTGKKCWQIL